MPETVAAPQAMSCFETQGRSVRILNWNIERGQQLSAVADFIQRECPDVCILQEVDLNARRTGRTDVAALLAARFGFNYVFGVEFQELSQGSRDDPAFHGQATMARGLIRSPRVLRFRHQSEFWRPHALLPKWAMFQPRLGGRIALAAELEIGQASLVIYNLHLESRGDDYLRLAQLAEVIEDSLRYPLETPVVIAGDLNTRDSPSSVTNCLSASGFRNACEAAGCAATKRSGLTLDWIFVRGPAQCSDSRVHQETSASDHYPVSTTLSFGRA